MSAYLNQFKRRIATQMGLAKTPEDENATKALMKIWGMCGEQPQNIFYRNRSECDSIWLPEVLVDSQIGCQVLKKINSIVSKEVKQRPDLDVWDMNRPYIYGKCESIYESDDWFVTFQKGNGAYLMKIYKKPWDAKRKRRNTHVFLLFLFRFIYLQYLYLLYKNIKNLLLHHN